MVMIPYIVEIYVSRSKTRDNKTAVIINSSRKDTLESVETYNIQKFIYRVYKNSNDT